MKLGVYSVFVALVLASVIVSARPPDPTPYCVPSYCTDGMYFSSCHYSVEQSKCVCDFSKSCLYGCDAPGKVCATPTPTPTPYCPPSYCADGQLYSGCALVLGRCSCSVQKSCVSGRCNLDGLTCYTSATPTPTPTPEPTRTTPTPTVTPTPAPCNDYCADRIFHSGGYRTDTGECAYVQAIACPYGCSPSVPGCAAMPSPTPATSPTVTPTPTAAVTHTPGPMLTSTPGACAPDCKNGCVGDNYMEKACNPNLPNICAIFNSYHCAAGCNNITKCNFRLGPAQFVDKDNITKPIRDAKVIARYTGPQTGGSTYCPPGQFCVSQLPLSFEYEGYTDWNGMIVVPGVNLTNHSAGTLTVTVFLADVNNTIAVHVHPEMVAVPNKTAVLNFSRPETFAMNLTFSQGDERVLAKIYYHAWEASYFARVGLGMPIDYLAPEEFWYKSPGCGTCNACHFGAWCGNPPSDDWIHFCDNPTKYDNVYYDASPTNMEWHEFGHHVTLDRYECFPVRAGSNHGGWSNPNSTDSYTEGFAEFFSMMNLQYWDYPNQNLYWVGQPGSAINMDLDLNNPEEMAVASTLYRMLNHQSSLFPVYVYNLNHTVNGTDCVHLSRSQMWGIIGSQHTFAEPHAGTHYIASVWDLYRAFNQSSIPSIHQDCDGDGINNLDEIFIAHRFFYDGNNNGKWDQGEGIGYTRWHDENWDVVKRYDSPEIPGNFIQLNVTNPDGSPAEEYNMTVYWTFDCGEGPGGYNYTVLVHRGEMPYFYPPTDNCNATANITVSTDTLAASPIPLDNQDYWQRYNESNPYVYSFAPQLQEPGATPTPVATPTPTPECEPGKIWDGTNCTPFEGPVVTPCPLGFILAGLGGIAVAVAWKKKR